MEEATLTAAIAAVVGAVGTLAGAGVTGLTAWDIWKKINHRIKQESDASALGHYEGVIRHLEGNAERQARRIERQDAHVEALAAGIERLRLEHAGCQAQIDEVYSWVTTYYLRCCEYVRRARRDPDEEVPAPPPRPPRQGGAQHQARTLEQQSLQVRELARGDPPREGAP